MIRPEVLREALANGWELEEDWSTYDAQRGAKGWKPGAMPSDAWDASKGKKVWMHSETGHQFHEGDRVEMPGSSKGYGVVKGLHVAGGKAHVRVATEKGEFPVEPDSLRPYSKPGAFTADELIANHVKMHGRPPSEAQVAKLRKKYPDERSALATAAGRTAVHLAAEVPEPDLEEAATCPCGAPLRPNGTCRRGHLAVQ